MRNWIITYLLVFTSLSFADGLEYQIHDVDVDDYFRVDDFVLWNFSDAFKDVHIKLTNKSDLYLDLVKIRYNFYLNGNLVGTDYSYLNYYTYEDYGMTPHSFALVESLTEKVEFDSIGFEVNYNIKDGSDLVLNKDALQIVDTNINEMWADSQYSQWMGSVKNESNAHLYMPKVFCCVYKQDELVCLRLIYADINGDSLAPGEQAFFDTLIELPAEYDSIRYLPHYNIDKSGNIALSVKTSTLSTPENFYLSQNYPNPFNASTSIDYLISKASDVKLLFYNVKGEMVKEILSGIHQPGIYTVVVDFNDLPSGIYYYSLTVGREKITKALLYVK